MFDYLMSIFPEYNILTSDNIVIDVSIVHKLFMQVFIFSDKYSSIFANLMNST